MDDFKTQLLGKISNLTENQQKELLNFLDNKVAYVSASKNDVIVLAGLLRDLRNTKAFIGRSIDKSSEKSVYHKHIKAKEKEIEQEIYAYLRLFNVQLRKGGYDSALINTDFDLNEKEKEIFDSIFPENKFSSTNTIIVQHPDLTEAELLAHDIKAVKRHSLMRTERTITPKTPEDLESAEGYDVEDLETMHSIYSSWSQNELEAHRASMSKYLK